MKATKAQTKSPAQIAWEAAEARAEALVRAAREAQSNPVNARKESWV